MKQRTVIITRDLAHHSSTYETYEAEGDECPFCYGYPLADLFPDLPLGHGTKLRVTVEVIDEGRACPVRKWKDTGCTR